MASLITASDSKPNRLEGKVEKRKAMLEKVQRSAGILKGDANEPIVRIERYKEDLIKALNYYNVAYETSDLMKWTLEYVGAEKAKILGKLSDYRFQPLGSLIRLQQRGQYLEPKELGHIDSIIVAMIKQADAIHQKDSSSTVLKTKKAIPITPEIIASKVRQEANRIAAEFDGMIDDFLKKGKETAFLTHLQRVNPSNDSVELIPAMYSSTIIELKTVLDKSDPDLKEGYSNFSLLETKKLLQRFEMIVSNCNEYISSNTKTKVTIVEASTAPKPPRVIKPRKPVSPAKMVEKLKVKKEDLELGLVSIPAVRILKASTVVLYNTLTRKMSVLVTKEDGEKMTVKGTTINGFDPVLSTSKTFPKKITPIIKDLIKMGKRDFTREYTGIKSASRIANGRMSDDSMILAVY